MRLRILGSAFQAPNSLMTTLTGVSTILWGIWIGNPWWSVFPTGTIYDEMRRFAPQWLFGVWAIGAGLFMLRGVWKGSYHSLTTGAMVGSIHWFSLAMLYFLARWQDPYGLFCLYIGAQCILVYLGSAYNEFLRSKDDRETRVEAAGDR